MYINKEWEDKKLMKKICWKLEENPKNDMKIRELCDCDYNVKQAEAEMQTWK